MGVGDRYIVFNKIESVAEVADDYSIDVLLWEPTSLELAKDVVDGDRLLGVHTEIALHYVNAVVDWMYGEARC